MGRHHRLAMEHLPPSIKATLLTWYATRSNHNLTIPLSSLVPITTLTESIQDLNLGNWLEMGISKMGDLYDRDGLLTFSNLQKAYKLPDAQIYTYLRVRHYLQANQWLGKHRTTKFESKCWTPTYKSKGTTIILYTTYCYKNMRMSPLLLLKNDLWHQLFRQTSKFSKALNHHELTFKLMYRWYMAPDKIQQASPIHPTYAGDANVPWGRCYIFAQTYWHKIRDHIYQSTGILTPLKPAMFLLGLEVSHVDRRTKKWIIQILLASRSLLARYWKQNFLPSTQEISKEVERIQLYERVFYFYQQKTCQRYINNNHRYLLRDFYAGVPL
ncbi:hypothetical protein XELAEV_18012435mg [Xenopus laevis]|uniref:Uncharacterized protein n=1 Tax=Xenopus laevis TaxID=8355 RepID=A0A974HYE3_XENLA|nr:hypothetical protein XELAEV_18012435mg [Xenopus laevis]